MLHPAADLLRRDFCAPAPDRVWLADIERHEALLDRGPELGLSVSGTAEAIDLASLEP